ncbi:MAG TPA: hypothetical protein VFL36_18220 [Myxococcales bacterium]|nr:hypothetical protein [Myxococcales bacterium]
MTALFAVLLAASAAQARPPREGTAPAPGATREEAERAYRASIRRAPSRWSSYAGLAALLSEEDDRWERADETLALLERGLSLAPPRGKVSLAIRVADFERSVGRLAQARERLSSLAAQKPDPSQSRRIRALLDRIAEEERAREMEDWPEPQPSAAQQAALSEAERKLQGNDARGALAAADVLCAAEPGWRAAHWLRARALDAVGRVDEEARELRALTQLSPSHAAAWRRLGEILAAEGGLLEADRADEALRQALSLEPSWSELWILRARVALRQGRAQDAMRDLDRYALAGGVSGEAARLAAASRAQAGLAGQALTSGGSAAREPSAAARALLQRAAGEPPERARDLLAEALQDSPAFVEAAAALYALSGTLPDATLEALRGDAERLLELAAQVRRAGGPPALVAPWIDRAVELGAPESRYVRAQLRIEQGDRAGALGDLLAYAASPQAPHLREARALRAQLVPPSRGDLAPLEARLRLAEDRPEAALAALGSRCEAGTAPDRLLLLGEVHEFAGELPQALECYRLASPLPAALRRLARVAERAPDARAGTELEAAAAQGVPEALWALARIDLAAGRRDQALPRIERFLAAAAPDDAGLAAARAARDALLEASNEKALQRSRRRAGGAAAGLALLLGAASWLWAGSTLQSALRRRPRLFPPAARAVNELRHDLLKHRAGVLGMLAEPGASREDVARALLSPEPASATLARHYETLRTAARGQGVSLRRLAREPTFGPLARDLARAESLLRGSGGDGELLRIDARIRGEHAARLAALLRLGPRTRLDAAAVAGWIRDVEAEMRRGGSRWTAPSILLQGMGVEFAVEREALSTIFANLLRNAQAAAAGGEVIVKLGEEHDAAGRNLTVLLVGDSSAHTISLEAIEQRESGRGLSLVRDLTREWQGHVVVRAEEPPWKKAVGACFPAPPS